MAVKSVPSKRDLFCLLAVDDSHYEHPMFMKSVLLDMADHSTALSSIITVIHNFLVENNLDFPDQV